MRDITVGATVRHPSRGTGIVATVIVSPLTGKAIRAWVEFPFQGGATRKFVCFADDLTVVPAPTPRPSLQIVHHAPEVA